MSGRGWVADRFDVRVTGDDELGALVQLALRRNPRRAHLLVSTVLGKHVPADPRRVRATGLRLADKVRGRLGGETPVVLGFAETATGLGHLVAQGLQARYVHSTRRRVESAAPLAGFEEEHSHATAHLLFPHDSHMLAGEAPLVLVDDELSTGRTVLNTIRALHGTGRRRYVVATLVDLRGPQDRTATDSAAAQLGVEIDVVSLARGQVSWPTDFPDRAASLVAAAGATRTTSDDTEVADLRIVDLAWPVGVVESGRHGFGPADVRRATAAAVRVASSIASGLGFGPVLVLGTEELMYVPMLIACALADSETDVRVSSTTRSPVHIRDVDGYPVRTAITFTGGADAMDGPGPRFAYNVVGFDDVVLVRDHDEPGLVQALRQICRRVHVVDVPSHVPTPPPLRGPEFGSYRPDEVAWLLTDLSDVELEAPTEEREEAVQSGGAHYAESLPIEYRPDAEYRTLYERALNESARRIAHAVGVVTEIVLTERGTDIALASLARAGTPLGILLRRWAAYRYGLDVPHYAVSIVRGRGIDTAALRHLAGSHDPAGVVFVDGWTGKGAIARELSAAIETINGAWSTAFDPSLAVLADPGSCVTTFGTREDFLVPSACLNSTVSGLVSRTVLNTEVLSPGQFHGAKFYRDLAADDVSHGFLDAVSAQFGVVAAAVERDWAGVRAGDRRATWSGWAAVEAIAADYEIGDLTLVKPGVGETTRVLLRRVPWLVLVRPDAGPELDHVRLLAKRRGVPVRESADLPYSCVGIVHPAYSRGASGADGRAVARR